MLRSRLLIVAALCSLPLISACGSKQECERCSGDSECSGTLVCKDFTDGNRRCGGAFEVTECLD